MGSKSKVYREREYLLIQKAWILKFFFGFISFYLIYCNFLPYSIKSVQLCDLWDSHGFCKEPWKNHTKIYKIPKEAVPKIKTNKDLTNYLYFNLKETPGILVYFTRELSFSEWQIESSDNCRFFYIFQDKKYPMEGFEFKKNFIGGFQYLGSILEKEWKSKGKLNTPVDWDFLKNINLRIERYCNKDKIQLEVQISIIK